jgi:hypothetical protein
MTYPVDGASCPVTGHAIGREEIRRRGILPRYETRYRERGNP